jgi:hypothetical protein
MFPTARGNLDVHKPSISPKPLFEKSVVTDEDKAAYTKAFPSAAPLFADSRIVKQDKSKQNLPKVMFTDSKIRKRIEISLSDLATYDGSEEVKREAHQLILTTNVDELSVEYVLNWGGAAQIEHKGVLQSLLDLALERETTVTKNIILRLIDLLNSIDFDDLNKSSLFTSKESKMKKASAVLKSVNTVSVELLDRVGILKAAYSSIRGIKKKLEAIERAIAPWVISCDFFSKYVKDNFPTDLFLSRLTSLMSTQVAIIQNKQQQQFLEKQAITLIESIESIVQTDAMLWQNAFLTAITTATFDPITLQTQRDSIVSKLKNTVS